MLSQLSISWYDLSTSSFSEVTGQKCLIYNEEEIKIIKKEETKNILIRRSALLFSIFDIPVSP